MLTGYAATDTVEYQTNSYPSLTSPNDQYAGVYQAARGNTLVLTRLNGRSWRLRTHAINGFIKAEV